MALRTKSVSVLAGLALIAVISAGRGEAQAGTIGLMGHITPLPGGSPFLYSFELDLNDLNRWTDYQRLDAHGGNSHGNAGWTDE